MAITMIQSVPVGNALRVFLAPPVGSLKWRVLRRPADTFTGFDDAGAYVVYEGAEKVITDLLGLYNGVTVFYKVYYWDGAVWIESPSRTATPKSNFADESVDVLGIVRDRLDLGIQTYVDAGKLQHPRGHIPVMTAAPTVENTDWPVITVHLSSDSPEVRGLGELVGNDVFLEGDYAWNSIEGWLSRVQLSVYGWTLNSDERIALRKAIKTVLIANFSVFDSLGISTPELQFSDQEDYVSYGAPVYQCVGSFSCVAATAVQGTDPAIRSVSVSVSL